MARTKQTARRSKGGRAPRRLTPQSHQFNDHTGRPYTTVTYYCQSPAISKLSLHLYCLQDVDGGPEALGRKLLGSGDISGAGNMRNYWPRVDVYPPLASIEECMQHHLAEKIFRRKAVEDLHESAASAAAAEAEAAGGDEYDVAEAKLEAVYELRGKEPLPHIVPTWCDSAEFWNEYRAHKHRYRSVILVVPQDCKSWEDITQKGLYFVYFDQDVSSLAMMTETWDEPEDEGESLLEDGHEWVWVEKLDHGPPVKILRVAVEQGHDLPPKASNGIDFDGTLWERWYDLFSFLGDCTYRSVVCEGCYEEGEHDCEIELDEHYFDNDGQCVACRRHEEYRRRSTRLERKRDAQR